MNYSNYYRTKDRGLYVYLVNQGYTDTLEYHHEYDNPKARDGHTVRWSWLLTPELDAAITEYYEMRAAQRETTEDYKHYRVVMSPDVKIRLAQRGYEPFAQEPDMNDYHRKVWLYKPSKGFNAALKEAVEAVKVNRVEFD